MSPCKGHGGTLCAWKAKAWPWRLAEQSIGNQRSTAAWAAMGCEEGPIEGKMSAFLTPTICPSGTVSLPGPLPTAAFSVLPEEKGKPLRWGSCLRQHSKAPFALFLPSSPQERGAWESRGWRE